MSKAKTTKEIVAELQGSPEALAAYVEKAEETALEHVIVAQSNVDTKKELEVTLELLNEATAELEKSGKKTSAKPTLTVGKKEYDLTCGKFTVPGFQGRTFTIADLEASVAKKDETVVKLKSRTGNKEVSLVDFAIERGILILKSK